MADQHINQEGIALIKRYEGLRLEAYLDIAGVPTIGYGHVRDVKLGQRLRDEAHADELLAEDILDAEAGVNRKIDTELTDNEFSALVSMVFNLGAETALGGNSSIPSKVRNGDKAGAAATIKKYVYATVNGKKVKVQGLINRRTDEAALFLKQETS